MALIFSDRLEDCPAACQDLQTSRPDGTVAITLSEPAVIQHQHLNSQFCRLTGYLQDFFFIEIKVCGLPVVNQDRLLAYLYFPLQICSLIILWKL